MLFIAEQTPNFSEHQHSTDEGEIEQDSLLTISLQDSGAGSITEMYLNYKKDIWKYTDIDAVQLSFASLMYLSTIDLDYFNNGMKYEISIT